MITIPMIDWVAKAGNDHPFPCSFPATLYPNQQSFDPYDTNCGNGVNGSGNNITGNDPSLANVQNSVSFENGWVQHLVQKWGKAASGGVPYYIMDNEHSIWFSTHRDVHPVGPTMDEIESKMAAYGGMVKANDPTALVVGPEEWGWEAYFYSGYDQQYVALNGYGYFPDRSAHGNMDYMPWLLQALHQDEVKTGVRKLDVFSLHFYPQGGEYGNDVSTATELLRNRSTRGLWDPNYLNESWINDYVMLIPRMKQWVATYYPGLKTAITEYNWGAEAYMNGATTQADIYGIFGREGLDMATRWTTPDASTPTYKAMKMYRNYDGSKSGFGDVSVQAVAPDADTVSAFAAQRSSDGALTVMVISKYLSGATPVTVSLAGFNAASPAQVWQLNSANTITRLSDAAVNGNAIALTLPAQSITLLVVPQGPPTDFQLSAATPAAVSVAAGNASQPIALQVSASGQFSGAVDLSCSGSTGASCAFTPSAIVYPRTGAPANVTLQLGTTASTVSGTVMVSASAAGFTTKTSNVALTMTTGSGSSDLGLALAQSATTPNPIAVGGPFALKVTVTNSGSSSVTANVVLQFSARVRFAATTGCSGNAPMQCSVNVPAAGSVSFTLNGAAPLTHMLNIAANVSSADADPTPADNSATLPVRIQLRPFLRAPRP